MGSRTTLSSSALAPCRICSIPSGLLCRQPLGHLEDTCYGDIIVVLYYDPDERTKHCHKRSTKKVMATIFWNCKGIVAINFNERNTPDNGTYYATLLHKLLQNIREKRREKLPQVRKLKFGTAVLNKLTTLRIVQILHLVTITHW